MAIKVQGTTIIDDSRNIVNGIGASFTGIVTASSFSGSGSGLTGVGGTGEFLQDADGNLFAGTNAGGGYDPASLINWRVINSTRFRRRTHLGLRLKLLTK